MLASDHTTTFERPRAKKGDDPVAIRMAELFVRNARKGYETTREDLEADDFSSVDIIRCHADARRIARDTLAARDVAESAEYDRAGRIEKAAQLVAGMITSGEGPLFVTLRQNGYPTTELGKLYPEIIARACAILAGNTAEAPAEVH